MDSQSPPIVVHECERCGATQTPEQSGQVANVSGIVSCKVCGYIGPLRIRLIEKGLSKNQPVNPS